MAVATVFYLLGLLAVAGVVGLVLTSRERQADRDRAYEANLQARTAERAKRHEERVVSQAPPRAPEPQPRRWHSADDLVQAARDEADQEADELLAQANAFMASLCSEERRS